MAHPVLAPPFIGQLHEYLTPHRGKCIATCKSLGSGNLQLPSYDGVLFVQEAQQRFAIVALGLPHHTGIRCPIKP